MPELPEVETIKRELGESILGKKITCVIINNSKVIKDLPREKFIRGIENTTIKNIFRKGKLLIFELSSNKSLTIHLKMTGQLIYPGNGRNSRVSFKFSDDNLLDFNDVRLFGELRLVDKWQELKFVKELGPEPFVLSLEQFKNILFNKKTKIKPLLMDQKFISGIGNLYAAEVLFKARIHPQRAASSLTNQEVEILFKEIKNTLSEAIKHKGSSLDQYVRLSGEQGGYVKYHKVYGRDKKPCLVCGISVKRISLAGRGTYFCPGCQKMGNKNKRQISEVR